MNLINPSPINPNIRFQQEFEKAYEHVLDHFEHDSRNENEDVLVQRMYRNLYRFERVISTNQEFIEWVQSENTRMIFQTIKYWLKETQRKIYPINHINILNNQIDSLVIARHGLQLAMILLEQNQNMTYAQHLAMTFIAEYGDLDNIVLSYQIKEKIMEVRK